MLVERQLCHFCHFKKPLKAEKRKLMNWAFTAQPRRQKNHCGMNGVKIIEKARKLFSNESVQCFSFLSIVPLLKLYLSGLNVCLIFR